MEELQYPIGRFQKPSHFTSALIEKGIKDITNFPSLLGPEVINLSNEQLDTPYRPKGWTIRQVVHHCADSHMNSLIRFKLAITEENPTIKPYAEQHWAELADTTNEDIHSSLEILRGVHTRLGNLLQSLHPTQLERTFIHPEMNKQISLNENILLYAWHGQHHLAHIVHLKKRKNW